MSVKSDPIFKLGSEVLQLEKFAPKLKPQSLEIWGTKLKPTPREPPMKIEKYQNSGQRFSSKRTHQHWLYDLLWVWVGLMTKCFQFHIHTTYVLIYAVGTIYHIENCISEWHWEKELKTHPAWPFSQFPYFGPMCFQSCSHGFCHSYMCLLFHKVFKFTFLFSSIALKNK